MTLNGQSDLTFSLYRDKWKERDRNGKPNAYDQYNGGAVIIGIFVVVWSCR